MFKNNEKNAFTLIELIIVIAIIAVLAAMSKPNIHHGNRALARQKACFSNQRVLQGAIEMYNMDIPQIIHTALPNGDFGDLEELLIREKYLKNYLELPEEDCAYGVIDLDGSGGNVFCKRHGTTATKDDEHPIIPEYDKSLEKPFSYAYLQTKKRIQREKEYRKILQITVAIVKSPPFIIIAIICIVSFSLSGRKKKNVVKL